MAPSPISIATSSLQRLIKEEASYHKELAQQQARLTKIERETDDENQEFLIKQEKAAIEETKKVFPELEKRIDASREKLESLLSNSTANDEEQKKAQELIDSAKSRKSNSIGV